MKVYVETYGCAANKNNSEIIISKALAGKNEVVSSEKDADIVVVNTCTVKHLTEQKIFSRLRKLKELGVDVIVTGCMVPVQNEELKTISEHFQLIGWNELDKFNRIFGIKNGQYAGFTYDKLTKIVQINYGCLGNCSFCIVKLVKGSVKSRSIEEIIEEIEDALKRGYKEIYLTSTDTAAYGFDIQKRLPDLIKEILDRFDGDYIIRIGMMNPMLLRFFYKKFIDLYTDERMYKFLHLPIQSGSEKVLMEMQRPGKVEEFYKMHEEFMKTTNNLGNFATDIIVGYPTETEEDFNKTIEVVKNLQPDMTHVSKFGPRKGTEASMLKKLPSQVVKERSKILSKIVKDIAKEKNKKWVGKSTKVLVKQIEGNKLVGRNKYYKPVIIENESSSKYIGKWVDVKITTYTHSHLIGRMI